MKDLHEIVSKLLRSGSTTFFEIPWLVGKKWYMLKSANHFSVYRRDSYSCNLLGWCIPFDSQLGRAILAAWGDVP